LVVRQEGQWQIEEFLPLLYPLPHEQGRGFAVATKKKPVARNARVRVETRQSASDTAQKVGLEECLPFKLRSKKHDD